MVTEGLAIIHPEFAEKEVVRHLLELYLYDSSMADDNLMLNQFGLYGYPDLDHYWVDKNRYTYLFLMSDSPIGFALINQHCLLQENQDAYSISDFFVMKKYRQYGIGRIAVQTILEEHPGRWEVRVLSRNETAKVFWRSVLNELTGAQYVEKIPDTQTWDGSIFSFENRS
jgi:predicted acetyltransferase